MFKQCAKYDNFCRVAVIFEKVSVYLWNKSQEITVGLAQSVLLKNTDMNVCATEASICKAYSGTGIPTCEVCKSPKIEPSILQREVLEQGH